MANTVSQDTFPVKFHFFKLTFNALRDSPKQSSEDIVHAVVNFLNQEQQAGRGILIDRHEERGNESARPLFVTHAATNLKEKRMKLSMALLRTGKIPMLKPTDKFLLVPLDTTNGQIAEQTHIFIDYSTPFPIMCIEFNSNGPRVSDIEYYFRIVAKDKLGFARKTQIEYFMDTSIDKTLADLKNVLNIEFKVQPQKLSQLDTVLHGQYFTSMSNMGQHLKPGFVKLELLFQAPGRQIASAQINTEGNKMIRKMLDAFKAKPTNIDVFENFVVKYETQNGGEEVFNLLKGKKEIVKNVDSKITTVREWYELIASDFDNFVERLR